MIDHHPRTALAVPADTIRMTSALLRSMQGMEACCFWFGQRQQSDIATVEAIVVPRQQNNRGHYHVVADSMIQVADVGRELGWKNLAQVHSHPGTAVGHSGYDDEMANSRRALSLVYPKYGSVPGMWRFHGWLWSLWPKPLPHEIGVHAFIEGKWAFLNRADISTALRLISGPSPAFVDLRS
jgi:hypothetical protein